MSSKGGPEEKKDKRKESLQGSFVGNYEILQTIGEGSFAKVKLAKHRLTHQKVPNRSFRYKNTKSNMWMACP